MIPAIDKERTGRRLERLMRERGMTPRGLQEYLSLACVQTVYRWFSGENLPSIDNLYALGCLFGTGVDAMLLGDASRECVASAGRMVLSGDAWDVARECVASAGRMVLSGDAWDASRECGASAGRVVLSGDAWDVSRECGRSCPVRRRRERRLRSYGRRLELDGHARECGRSSGCPGGEARASMRGIA